VLCRQCRTANRDDAQFCSKCGAPLVRPPATAEAPSRQPASVPARRGQATGLIIGVVIMSVILVLMLCAFGGYMAYRWSTTARPRPQPTPAASTRPEAPASTQAPAKAPTAPPTWGLGESGPTVVPPPEPQGRYVFAGSADRLVADGELRGLSDKDLCIARNEIFARHGLIFQSPPLRDYFESQPWYSAETSNQASVEAAFNSFERQNVARVKAVETSRRSKYLKGSFSTW
jgi:hypothetical protein